MRRIAIVFAAVAMLGLAVPAGAAPDARARGSCVQGEATAPVTAEELTSRRRNVNRRGWRGHRHWRGHRWHGRRAWHGRRYYRGPRWHGRRYWGGRRCFGNQGRCVGIWRSGRKVIVCCR